jgi:hypothetical protein
MNSWIDLTALWQIVVVGLVAGAGLPALFAVGMVALSQKGGARAQTAAASGGPGGAGGADSDSLVGGSMAGMIAAALCFLIVLACIGWAIFAIYESGHPHK